MFTVGHVDASGKPIPDQIDEATALLLETVDRLDDAALREPSLLDGWTRGHVLTHLARGADAMRDLLKGGQGYPSQEARDADIEAGARRPAVEQAADVRSSAQAFRDTVLAQPEEAWLQMIMPPLGVKPFPAAQLLIRRLVEIELHHVDLNFGYKPSDWPVTFNELELVEPMRGQRADRIV